MSDATAFEIRFHIHGDPGGSAQESNAGESSSGVLPRITQVLALAISLDEMLRTGAAKDYADIARLSGLSRERISQIMRLNYLAPDIQVELLFLQPTPTGRYPISETATRDIANTLSWPKQRDAWRALKASFRMA